MDNNKKKHNSSRNQHIDNVVNNTQKNGDWDGNNQKCDWSWDSDCLPKDNNYELPGKYKDEVFPVPPCCKKFNLDNKKTSIINREGSNLDYIYVDGRKFLIDKGDIDKCYTAALWMNPDLRKNCDSDYEDKIDISKNEKITIDEVCFRQIPTESGFNETKYVPSSDIDTDERLQALDCNRALRPSQKNEAAQSVAKEANFWTNRSKKNIMLYNTKTALATSKYNEINNINGHVNNSLDNSNQKNNDLKRVKSEILSKQRQIEISNDEVYKINERIYFLKILFIYLILLAILGFLFLFFNKGKGRAIIFIIAIVVSVIFAILVIGKLHDIRARHPERWPLRQWKGGDLPKVTGKKPQSEEEAEEELLKLSEEEENVIKREESEEEVGKCGKLGCEEAESEEESSLQDRRHRILMNQNQKYKCVKVEAEEEEGPNPDDILLEEEIADLNNKIKQCNIKQEEWNEKKSNLKKK